MKILKYLSLFVIAIAFVATCTSNFEEINDDIDNPTSIPSDLVIGTIVRGMANTMYSTFNGAEAGMTWAQHEAMIQYNDPERYKPRITTMDGVWRNFYTYASNADKMYELAEAEENDANMGVALVLKAYSFHILTDLYGDIPYTEALLGSTEGNFKPVYDEQETVYTGIIETLDMAIAKLSTGNGTTSSSMDIVYNGDSSKWLKYAYSLKFRALMRISGKVAVGSQLQSIVNSGMLFSSNSDEAKLVYLSNSPNANPLFESIVEGAREEHKMNATFIDFLIANDDGRLPVYAQEAANGGYVGKPSGYSATPVDGFGYDDVSSFGAKYLLPEAPAYFVSYTELLFLMAEAAHKTLISGGETAAEMYYNSAIENSFAENGVAGEYAAYISQGTVVYSTGDAMKRISEQKWVTLFSQGFEAWTEYRRTGYPVLELAIDAYTTEIPSRYKYNSDESSLNGANYNAAISSQGPDELITPIWWME